MKHIYGARPIRVPHSEDIGLNRWERGTATLTTTGATQCIIVAAHNSLTLEGLVGHFTEVDPDYFTVLDPGQPSDSPEGSIAFSSALQAIPELGPLDATSIWAGGGVSHPEGAYFRRASIIDREYTLAKLALLGAAELETGWLTDGQISAQLNCEMGVLETHWRPI